MNAIIHSPINESYSGLEFRCAYKNIARFRPVVPSFLLLSIFHLSPFTLLPVHEFFDLILGEPSDLTTHTATITMEASNPPSGEGTAPAAQDATPTEPDLSNTVATITPDAISPTASEKESDLDLSNKATETHILQTTSDLNEIKDEDEKKPRNLQVHFDRSKQKMSLMIADSPYRHSFLVDRSSAE